MKKIYIWLILSSFSIMASAQKHDAYWLFGYEWNGSKSTIFNFNVSPMQKDSILRNMGMNRSCVSMSDSVGNLLFYTNSIVIHNSQHLQIENGDSLNPGELADEFKPYGYPLTGGSIAIPHPNQANKYYLFHQSMTRALALQNFVEHLYYTLIDMSANGGLGRVVLKNQILASDSLGGGQLQAVKHGNNRDWWLVQTMGNCNGYYVFLVAGDSIVLHSRQYIGEPTRVVGFESWGQAVFSPDGTKYARYDGWNDLEIFDFDRCSGYFSYPIHISIQDSFDILGGAGGTGVAFSSNSQYLYVGSNANIYQFDMISPNIAATKDTVARSDGFYYMAPGLRTYFSALALAPDGKIYGHAESTPLKHVINSPDLAGMACDVVQHGVDIFFSTGHFMPNFPHYRTPMQVCAIGVTESPLLAAWEAYPNPVRDVLYISGLQAGETVVLWNSLGQVAAQGEAEGEQLGLSVGGLPRGLYWLRAAGQTKVIVVE
jgi:hypothetical protein